MGNQSRRLNDCTPQEWSDAYTDVMQIRNQKIENDLTQKDDDDNDDGKIESDWEEWRPSREFY